LGQKVHPRGFRLGITSEWEDQWYAEGQTYADNVQEDKKIRDEIRDQYDHALISKIVLKRFGDKVRIDISASRTGIIIGRGGSNIQQLREDLLELTGRDDLDINIEEVATPETDARLISQEIAQKIERRVNYRRAMKESLENAMRKGALGAKVHVAGRLNGADIASKEWYQEGRVPLHTLRANIDYGFTEAETKFGIIGVKAWVFKGEEL
jgi:small subunit ribosomal protein S3